ncbi:MAG: sulfatase [Patescibacteria group bacterium]
MKKPNIILITLDALRADHLGVYGYKKNTSPFIDSIAKRGVVFKNSFSVGAATPQSFAGIMASTYPLDFGGYTRITEQRTLLQEALQGAGYITMGFHSNAYLSEYFGYGRGWDKFSHLNYFSTAVSPGMKSGTWQSRLIKRIGIIRRVLARYARFLEQIFLFFERIASTVRRIFVDLRRPIQAYFTAFEMNNAVKKELSELAEQDGEIKDPIFLWVHYMDAHAPYGLFLRRGRGFLSKIKSYFADYLFDFWSEYPRVSRLFLPLYLGLYDDGIRHIDEALKDLFGYLSSKGVLNEESVVFITADHGEEFNDHGGFQHMQKFFNENIKVPLIAVGPEKLIGKPRTEEIPRSSMDIAPTILCFAGARRPQSFRGGNLFDGKERDVIAEISDHEADLSGIKLIGRCLVAEKHKLISDSQKLLFPLDDPEEKNNLYGEKKELAARLEKRLKEFKNE